jgi:sarcosine oxidase, subunit beta
MYVRILGEGAFGSMEKAAEIIIIGGGIIGTSLAYHLGQKGAKGVVLLERGMLGEGSTAKCVGGIRFQFSTEINIRFSLESWKTWEQFEELTEVDLGFRKVGYLFLATTPDEWAIFQANAGLQKSYGIPVELPSPDEIHYRWPYLRVDDLQGGTFCPWEGYAGPYEALTGYAKGARKKGVKIYEGTEVQQVFVENGRVTGVGTSRGNIAAPIVINAAGPYAEGDLTPKEWEKWPGSRFRSNPIAGRSFLRPHFPGFRIRFPW